MFVMTHVYVVTAVCDSAFTKKSNHNYSPSDTILNIFFPPFSSLSLFLVPQRKSEGVRV
jgi:hypothetical protein